MKKRSYSLRGSILAVVLSLSATTLVALLFSATLYEKLVKEIEQDATESLIELEVSDLHQQLTKYSTELGITLQSISGIRNALKTNQPESAVAFLNDHFHQYYVTAGVIKLEKIYLLDKTFHYLAQSSDGMEGIELSEPLCANVAEQAKLRKGANRLKIASGLCTHNSHSLHTVIIPVGTLSPIGYLQIVIDPTFNVGELAHELLMPVKVKNPHNEFTYTTDDWPEDNDVTDYLFFEYPVKDRHHKVVYTLVTARDISTFNEAFQATTNSVLGVAVLIIVVGLIISGLVLKGSLQALKVLSQSAHKTGQGKYEQMPESACTELDDVISSYNTMVGHVQNSQQNLKHEVEMATTKLRDALNTVEKRNIELEEAVKLADQANKAKSAFLANMSHELRTPLNAVIGYSEILEDDLRDSLDEQSLTDLHKINTAGNHLLNIVKDILDLSKLESSRTEIELGEFDLRHLISDAVDTVAASAQQNNNTFYINGVDEPLLIYSDKNRLYKIIINLVDNAAKYTKNGDITINLYQEHRKNVAEYVIEVIDTGVGIADEFHEKVFEPFNQADNSTTRAYDGTGLGLALSKQLCAGLGGNIHLSSKTGEGSTFTVRIPQRYEVT